MIDGFGKEVAGRQTGNDKYQNHECNIPLGTLPRCAAIPQCHTDKGNDVGAVLGTGAEQHGKHEDRSQQRLTESYVLILVDTQIGNAEGQDTGNDEPEVAVGDYLGGASHHAQQGDVGGEVGHIACQDVDVVGILFDKGHVPLVILLHDVLRTGDGHGSDKHHHAPEETGEQEGGFLF